MGLQGNLTNRHDVINRELHFQSLKEKDSNNSSMHFNLGQSNPQTSKMTVFNQLSTDRNPFEVADFEDELLHQQRMTVRNNIGQSQNPIFKTQDVYVAQRMGSRG